MVQPEVLRPASEYIKKAFTPLWSTCEQPSLAALPGSLTRAALVYRQCGNGIREGGRTSGQKPTSDCAVQKLLDRCPTGRARTRLMRTLCWGGLRLGLPGEDLTLKSGTGHVGFNQPQDVSIKPCWAPWAFPCLLALRPSAARQCPRDPEGPLVVPAVWAVQGKHGGGRWTAAEGLFRVFRVPGLVSN